MTSLSVKVFIQALPVSSTGDLQIHPCTTSISTGSILTGSSLFLGLSRTGRFETGVGETGAGFVPFLKSFFGISGTLKPSADFRASLFFRFRCLIRVFRVFQFVGPVFRGFAGS